MAADAATTNSTRTTIWLMCRVMLTQRTLLRCSSKTPASFYRNDNHLDLQKGDIVAVEAQPGHDIGVVSLTGKLVLLQMQKLTSSLTSK